MLQQHLVKGYLKFTKTAMNSTNLHAKCVFVPQVNQIPKVH